EGAVVPAVLLALGPFAAFALWTVRTGRRARAWWALFAAFALVTVVTVLAAASEPTGDAAVWTTRGLLATATLGLVVAAAGLAVLARRPDVRPVPSTAGGR